MRQAFGVNPFSATVDLWLECPYGRVPLSQTASTFVFAAKPVSIPPCDGKIIVSIDGKQHSRPVRLPQGISPSDPHSAVVAADDLPF